MTILFPNHLFKDPFTFLPKSVVAFVVVNRQKQTNREGNVYDSIILFKKFLFNILLH